MRFETVNLSNKNQETQLARQINSLRKRGIRTLNIIPVEYSVEPNSVILSKAILHVERLQPDSPVTETPCSDLKNLIASAKAD